jgi:hypothetical protein
MARTKQPARTHAQLFKAAALNFAQKHGKLRTIGANQVIEVLLGCRLRLWMNQSDLSVTHLTVWDDMHGGGKVLNMNWSADAVHVISARRGNWEAILLHYANQNSLDMKPHSPCLEQHSESERQRLLRATVSHIRREFRHNLTKIITKYFQDEWHIHYDGPSQFRVEVDNFMPRGVRCTVRISDQNDAIEYADDEIAETLSLLERRNFLFFSAKFGYTDCGHLNVKDLDAEFVPEYVWHLFKLDGRLY